MTSESYSIEKSGKGTKKINDMATKSRGEGIPLTIKRKLVERFENHGFSKKNKFSAQNLYKDLTKTDKILHR